MKALLGLMFFVIVILVCFVFYLTLKTAVTPPATTMPPQTEAPAVVVTRPPETERPKWLTPTLAPLTGQNKPVMIVNKAKPTGGTVHVVPRIITPDPDKYVYDPRTNTYTRMPSDFNGSEIYTYDSKTNTYTKIK